MTKTTKIITYIAIVLVVITVIGVVAHFTKCEAKKCGFINALPIVSMTCGSMGKRKTTMITDMALSQEVMFRQKAFEILQKADMKFPYFPWILFEQELQKCMENHTLYHRRNGH